MAVETKQQPRFAYFTDLDCFIACVYDSKTSLIKCEIQLWFVC